MSSISDGFRRILVRFNPSSIHVMLLQAHLDTLTESVPHFLLSYPNWNKHHVVFSRYGKNNWCLGRIFVYYVNSAFQ